MNLFIDKFPVQSLC